MKKKLTKRMLLGVLAAAMFGISANDAEAQTFTNTGTGTYNASCNGVIRLKSATTATPAVQADITGNSIGTVTKPIPGIVEWSAASGNQVVLAKHYQRMILTGASTKGIQSGVFIAGVGAACTSPLFAGYTSLAEYPFYVQTTAPGVGDRDRSGDVSYLDNTVPDPDAPGTFNYASSSNYNIFPTVTGVAGTTTGVGAYGELNIGGTGTATVVATQTVSASHVVSVVGAPINVAGALNLGTGESNMQGDVTVAATTGTLTVGGGDVTIGGALALNGTLTIPDGTAGQRGDLNLDGTVTIATTGILDLGTNSNTTISGAITNAGDGNNLAFECSSTVTYDGTTNPQLVMPTLDTDGHRYGNLVLTGGNKQGGIASGYGEDVSVCTNFSLAGGNFDMFTNTGSLIMNAPTGTATYTALAEVEGSMVRRTDDQLRTYTFNNSATTISLAAVATNPTSMTLNVRPGATTTINNYQAGKDVSRKVNLAYAPTANVFEMTAQVGYKFEEGPKGSGATPAYWDAAGGSLTQTSVRLYEASSEPALTSGSREKIGTGESPTRGTAVATNLPTTPGTFGYVSLASIAGTGTATLPNDIGKFASGNDLVLSAGPTTFYSIADGRWTNPNTWDEGTIPTAIDNAELRHTVYVGIDGQFIGTTGAGQPTAAENNQYPEDGSAGAGTGQYATGEFAANNVTIINKVTEDATNPNTPDPALIIGNEDNGANYIFRIAGNLTNENTAPNNATRAGWSVDGVSGLTGKGTLQIGDIQGVWVTPYVTGAKIPGLGVLSISNAGTVNNEGVIEVGE